MFYISGRIADHVIVEKTGIAGDVNIDAYMAAIAINHGGVASDYYLFTLADNSTEVMRLQRGDEHEFIWVNDVITGIDFSIENNRKLFTIRTVDPNNKSVVKDTMVGDGVDSIIIQTKTTLPDEVTVDTSINATALMPVMVPDGRLIYLKANIVNGVGDEIIFKTKLEGIWSVVPTNIMVGTEKMRIWGVNGPGATNTVNVLMNL